MTRRIISVAIIIIIISAIASLVMLMVGGVVKDFILLSCVLYLAYYVRSIWKELK